MVIESVSVISTKWLRVYLTIYGLNRRVVEMRGEGGGKRISAKGKETVVLVVDAIRSGLSPRCPPSFRYAGSAGTGLERMRTGCVPTVER